MYDAQNRPAIVEYNGSKYAYVYNLQGDVMSIIDTTGTAVVYYKYDAWGKPISKTGTMAATLGTLNPFRYRGYVFDEETGLYYLKSRFYVPVKLRFLNADGLIKNNLFKYCANNPIGYVDHAGSEEQPVHDFTDILNKDLKYKETVVYAPLSHDNVINVFFSPDRLLSTVFEWDELVFFACTMMDGQILSYKNKSVWDATFPDLSYIGKDEKFIFRGETISREDYGNISFGYLGLAAGYSPLFLLFGAGVYKQAKTVANVNNMPLFWAVIIKPHEILYRVFNMEIDEHGNKLVLGNHLNDYEMICAGFSYYRQDHK